MAHDTAGQANTNSESINSGIDEEHDGEGDQTPDGYFVLDDGSLLHEKYYDIYTFVTTKKLPTDCLPDFGGVVSEKIKQCFLFAKNE